MPSVISLSPPVRSISLKSCTKTQTLKKKRPSTWTCHKHRRYTVSPRVSRWVSQHNQQKRQTMATISTLTTSTNSETTTINHHHHVYNKEKQEEDNIFHTQSLLFLFGFLFFPCWWIGGYYLKVENNDIEKKRMTMTAVHPSLLANGRTSSKLFWLSSSITEYPIYDTYQLFYKWNKSMSFVSIGLTLIITSLIIWDCLEDNNSY